MWSSILNIILGLWVMISPGLFDFEPMAASNSYIAGPLIITFAITAVWEVNRSVRYFNVVAGLWLAAAPLVLSFGTAALWNDLMAGILIAGLSLVKGKIKGRYGGGWRSLTQKDPLHARQTEMHE